MSEEMNGHANVPTRSQMHEFMAAFINPIVVGAVNGIIRSMPQIPIDEVLLMTCGLFGRMIGNTLSIGNLVEVVSLRSKCADAFRSEMRRVGIKPMPVQQPLDPELIRKMGGM